jgi:3'(2'), 5'-bisphosphate nucleotidase
MKSKKRCAGIKSEWARRTPDASRTDRRGRKTRDLFMEKELAAAKQLALDAGAILMQHYERGPTVDWKAPGDPVTSADREANEWIVTRLAREFPKDAILSEEQPDDLSRLDQSHVWMIDPMDGTREFIEHRGDFAVQIGLVAEGTPVLGVVYQPTTNRLYYAAKGRGAFVEANGKIAPLQVSKEDTAARMTLAVSRSHHSPRVDAIRNKLRIGNVFRIGSVGLKVAALCEGRADLYIHTGSRTHLWDTCGPEAILREAGGRMTDVCNQPLQYAGRELRNLNGLIASNGVVHDRAVQAAQAVLATFR